jgi:hypothetical protein
MWSGTASSPDIKDNYVEVIVRWYSLGLALAISCAKQIPPPEAPTQVTPNVKIPAAPPSGVGRVVIDVTDGPAVIEEVVSQTVVNTQQSSGTFTKTAQYNGPPIKRRLCVSPCVLDLPVGPHVLSFTTTGNNAKTDKTTIIFSEVPMVYRRSLGTKEKKPAWFAGIGGAGVGATLFTIGLVGLFVGNNALGEESANNVGAGAGPLTLADVSIGGSLGLMFAGAVVGGAGGFLMKKNQPISQQGSETFWTLTEVPVEPVATKPPPLQDPVFTKKNQESDMERAAKIFEEARAHYNLLEYDAALKGFKEAYLLSKEPGLLFNIGQCYRQMGKNDEAIRSFKAYLNESPDAPQKTQIEQWLAEMGQKL